MIISFKKNLVLRTKSKAVEILDRGFLPHLKVRQVGWRKSNMCQGEQYLGILLVACSIQAILSSQVPRWRIVLNNIFFTFGVFTLRSLKNISRENFENITRERFGKTNIAHLDIDIAIAIA